MDKTRHVVLGGIFRRTRDLGVSIDARDRSADVRCHWLAHLAHLFDRDCGGWHDIGASAVSEHPNRYRALQDAAAADVNCTRRARRAETCHCLLMRFSCWTAIAAFLAPLVSMRGPWRGAPVRS